MFAPPNLSIIISSSPPPNPLSISSQSFPLRVPSIPQHLAIQEHTSLTHSPFHSPARRSPVLTPTSSSAPPGGLAEWRRKCTISSTTLHPTVHHPPVPVPRVVPYPVGYFSLNPTGG
ncbi:hypothetical protein E2C01_072578 [Portunus trituberculatus]|uniref:Uncharacterized protein n=1 Tax=Portunus trituberculatus TaxID=210409 RepID=A0A5B7I088_PORTR|nr:hypothetical protein [Portunus trituberculatus]